MKQVQKRGGSKLGIVVGLYIVGITLIMGYLITVYCHIHSIGVIIDLNNFNGQGAYLPHRGRARTSHRHCEKKHTPEKIA